MYAIINKLNHQQLTSLMNFAKTLRCDEASAETRGEADASIFAYVKCLYHCDVITKEESLALDEFLSKAKKEEFAWFVKFMDM